MAGARAGQGDRLNWEPYVVAGSLDPTGWLAIQAAGWTGSRRVGASTRSRAPRFRGFPRVAWSRSEGAGLFQDGIMPKATIREVFFGRYLIDLGYAFGIRCFWINDKSQKIICDPFREIRSFAAKRESDISSGKILFLFLRRERLI